MKSAGASNLDPTPAFAFGHGLSYTTFVIEDLQVDSAVAPVDGSFTLRVRVRNTGDRAGTAVPSCT